MKKLGLGGAAAGGVPRAADGEGAGRNLVGPKLATRWLQDWLAFYSFVRIYFVYTYLLAPFNCVSTRPKNINLYLPE